MQKLRRPFFLPELEHVMLHSPYRRYDELPPLERLPLPIHQTSAEPIKTLSAGQMARGSHNPALLSDTFPSTLRRVMQASLLRSPDLVWSTNILAANGNQGKNEPENSFILVRFIELAESDVWIMGTRLSSERYTDSILNNFRKAMPVSSYQIVSNLGRARSASSQLSFETPQTASGSSGADDSNPEGSRQILPRADTLEAACSDLQGVSQTGISQMGYRKDDIDEH
jgi:hypothetical protein